MITWRDEIEGKGIRLCNALIVLSHKRYNQLKKHMISFYGDEEFEEVCEYFFSVGDGQLAKKVVNTQNQKQFHFEEIVWLDSESELDDKDYVNPYIMFMLELEFFLRTRNSCLFNVEFKHKYGAIDQKASSTVRW